MHPADAGFLYDIVRHSNAGVALLQIGEKDTTEFNKVVRTIPSAPHNSNEKLRNAHLHIHILKHRKKRRRTLKEIAEIALKHVDEQEKRGAQRPKPKMIIVKAKLNQIEEKRAEQLRCKYRKSCYETGIKCHYRKSCYETGKVPDLRWSNSNKTEEQPSKDAPRTVTQLKLSCKYRKSCYLQHVLEQAQLEDAAISHKQVERVQDREFEPTRPFQPAASIETKKEIPELSSKQQPQPSLHEAETTPAHERASKKYEILSSDNETVPWHVRKRHLKHRIEQVALQRKHARLLAKRENTIISQLSQSGRKLLCKYRKSCYETGVLPMFLQKEQEKSEEMKALSEAELKRKLACKYRKSCYERGIRPRLFCKYRKSCYETGVKPNIEHEERFNYKHIIEKRDVEIPLEIKCHYRKSCYETGIVPDLRASCYLNKTAEQPDLLTGQQPPQEEKRQVVLPPIKLADELKTKILPAIVKVQKVDEEKSRETKTAREDSIVKETVEPAAILEETTKPSKTWKPTEMKEKPRMVPHKEIRFIPPPTPPAPEEEIPPFKTVHIDGDVETGVVPNIDQEFFIIASFQKFMREFYEETEEIRREMSEEERKLSCKYRKSCYETGKLPQIEQETIKTIADTMKETTLSLHLRCKYRKSCYANYGIPAIKDTKRMPKPEAVIEKPSTSTVGEQAKVRTTEDQRKPHPPTTVDESDKKKTTKKSKKSEKKQDIEEELPYMQRALSEEKRPTTLALAQKLKCKYRIKCYEGVPMHKRADGRPCTIYHLSCRRMAGLPIKQRAPIGPNGRRLCRKKPKAEAAAK
uniref:Uncharacterized protein n=1 Tax=Parascaris equorum TaxID=6256 RepID=A0A914RVU4_PAREQ